MKRFFKMILSLLLPFFVLFRGSLAYASNNLDTLTVAVSQKWGLLDPVRVNSLTGYYILTHLYESLLETNEKGFYEPNLAKSWRVSDDMKSFEFEINTDRKFSDGSSLTAYDVKKAWEEDVERWRTDTGQGSLGAVSLLEGFSAFLQTGHISGIQVKNHHLLTLKFSKSCRNCLSLLASLRLSVTKKNQDQSELGTGPYVLEHSSEMQLVLKKNSFFPKSESLPKQITIRYLSVADAREALARGDVDLIHNISYLKEKLCDGNPETACLNTLDPSHLVVVLNGMKGEFFADSKLRQALQFLVHDVIDSDSKLKDLFISNFKLDSQVYMPLQQGRLDDKTVRELVAIGKPFVKALIQATEKKPIRYFARVEMNPIVDALKRRGLRMLDISANNPELSWINVYYTSFDVDLMIMSLSLTNGDPDGLYHNLGAFGALSSKMTVRKKTVDLLEQGRAFLERDKVDQHYQKVAAAVLEDVPWVHLGFFNRFFIYRRDRLKRVDENLGYKNNNFYGFERL